MRICCTKCASARRRIGGLVVSNDWAFVTKFTKIAKFRVDPLDGETLRVLALR